MEWKEQKLAIPNCRGILSWNRLKILPRSILFLPHAFRIKNTPETIQQAVDVLLTDGNLQFAFFVQTISKYFHNAKRLYGLCSANMNVLLHVGVKSYLKKCQFLTCHIDFLDHVIRSEHLEVLERAAEAIHRLKHCLDVTELWTFLGLCTVFRRFVPHLAHVAVSSTRKLVSVNGRPSID